MTHRIGSIIAVALLAATHAFAERVWVMADCDSNWTDAPFTDSLLTFDAQGRRTGGTTGYNTTESIGAGRQICAHTPDGSCWITELGAHHVKNIAPDGVLLADVPLDVIALDVTARGFVYALGAQGTLYVLDAHGRIVNQAACDGFDLVVDTVHGSIWVVGDAITRLDMNLSQQMTTDPIEWSAVSVDYDADGTAWVLERQYDPSRGQDRILHIAPDGTLLRAIAVQPEPYCVRTNRGRRKLWIAGSSGLFLYDMASGPVLRVDTAACWQVDRDDSNETVWVGGYTSLRRYSSSTKLNDIPFAGSHIHMVSVTPSAPPAPPLPPTISYIIPDEATPGMNSYVELIGQYDRDGGFGQDGIYPNNPGDAVRVICANAADASTIVIGPAVVSWNGKMISTQIFVMPGVTPNSWDWRSLAPQYRIPICAVVNGVRSNVDTVYIVQPQTFGTKKTAGVIGSGGAWGVRSRRGAMIVDSMILNAPGKYAVSTADCDPGAPGNQGYLPVTILSVGDVRVADAATLSVDANGMNGGPGGGGGGGVWNDSTPDSPTTGSPTIGGAGFSGGEGGTLRGGMGSGGDGQASGSVGGASLNGMSGGAEKHGSLEYQLLRDGRINPAGHEGTGGGSGFPFGTSGEGGLTKDCDYSNTVGGYSGGSGAGECGNVIVTSFGGGGGGNATDGLSFTSGGGHPSNNSMIVPFAGGSGGAGGNAWGWIAGHGGGGGGALAIYSQRSLHAGTLSAMGANGGDAPLRNTMVPWSGAGGGGSGGAIRAAAKLTVGVHTWLVQGGTGGVVSPRNALYPGHLQDGGDGGSGRLRIDGPLQYGFPSGFASATMGASTDTTASSATRTVTVSGVGDGSAIRLYVRPQNGRWDTVRTITNYPGTWSRTLTFPGTDTMLFLCTAQEGRAGFGAQYELQPSWILSQAGANLIRIRVFSAQFPMISSDSVLDFLVSACDSQSIRTIWVHNRGLQTLSISSATISGVGAAAFTLVQPVKFPQTIAAGDSAAFAVRFRPNAAGASRAELALFSNDSTHLPWRIQLAGTRDTASATVRIDTISANVGDMVAIPVNLSSSGNMGPCSGTSAAYELRYDRSLLVPLNAPSGVDVGRDRILSLTATRTQATGALDTLRFIATLGDTARTPLHFESFTWLDGGVTTTTIDGMFLLKNICQQGGARYVTIGSTAGLAQNAPNPFVDETAIRFQTNEPGPVRIIITDILGREVERVCDEQFPAGTYTCAVKGGRFAAGLYVCTMETPGFRRAVRMMKCR